MILLTMLCTASAGSSFRLSVAHEWGVPMDDVGSPMGPGFGGYIGYAFAAKIMRIVPEGGLMWSYDRSILVPRIGGRLQIGWLLTPGIYAHASTAIGEPFENGTLGFDGGLSFDVALPYVHVGAYAGIQAFTGESGPGIPDTNFVGGFMLTLAIPTSKKKEEAEE